MAWHYLDSLIAFAVSGSSASSLCIPVELSSSASPSYRPGHGLRNPLGNICASSYFTSDDTVMNVTTFGGCKGVLPV